MIAYADGSNEVINADGDSTFVDPYGVTTKRVIGEDGRIIETSTDGWTTNISADGKTIVSTGPNGEVETTVIEEDGSIVTNSSDGSSSRYVPETKQTTYTDSSGATYVMRTDQNGNEITTDASGAVMEYNPRTNTTSIIDAEGNAQIGERKADGSYQLTLEDGEVITFDADGNPINTNVSIVEDEEITTFTSEDACEGCVDEAIWNKEDATLKIDYGDNQATTSIGSDGVITVEMGGETRIYDPSTGTDGSSITTYEEGVTQMVSPSGGTTQISEDGLTMEISDSSGTVAVATAGNESYTVVIDGVEYVFPY